MGHLRDFWGKRFNKKEFAHLMPQDVSILYQPLNFDRVTYVTLLSSQGYAALMSDFDSFWLASGPTSEEDNRDA